MSGISSCGLLGQRRFGNSSEIALTSRTIAPNPYDYINEVSNPRLFAGRQEELSQIEEEISRLAAVRGLAPMVAVAGERRIGKTSLSLRVQELCQRYSILSLRISLTDMTAADPWAFWQEVFYGLLTTARRQFGASPPSPGFRPGTAGENSQFGLTEAQVEFFSAYGNRNAMVPPNYLVYEGLRSLIDGIVQTGQNGVLLIVDEAHLLVKNHIITQQLRFAIREAGRCGLLFVGEPELAQLFADQEQPLFAQARVIQLGNFFSQSDIIECALLPLEEDERALVSPMTIDYLVRLSRGKPNQIRLICHSIYNRYLKSQQRDLDITIEALDDVLESIAATYTDYDVQQKVSAIRRLSSVDLEMLYNMTRYPNWDVEEIVELDESFRAESKSLAAASRREATLREKREQFIDFGLMSDDPGKYILEGDEFLALYLRFWYEIRKHGQLSRSLVLGKGPATPFGEKTEKLVRFVVWELKRNPAFVQNIFSRQDHGYGDRIDAVKARHSALGDIVDGNLVRLAENERALNELFRTCELVSRPGLHDLLCLSVRNLDNPRETMVIELYFDTAEEPLVVHDSLLRALRQHTDDSRLLIEGFENFTVELLTLNGLLEAIGAPGLEELMQQFDTISRWRFSSVQRRIGGGDVSQGESDDQSASTEEEQSAEWITLYENGQLVEAEKYATRILSSETDRRKRARLYNDLGYIRYGLQKSDEAKRDLQTALDLHFAHLPLTLSNLGVAFLDEGNYKQAMACIQDAIFLTLGVEYVSAGHLRLRLPTGYRATQANWEQHPANVLEASYINLSFALLQSGSTDEAREVLDEGLDLMPSSVRLKQAMARLQLSLKRVDLAEPIYREIAEQPIPDPALANEINVMLRSAPRQRSNRRRNR